MYFGTGTTTASYTTTGGGWSWGNAYGGLYWNGAMHQDRPSAQTQAKAMHILPSQSENPVVVVHEKRC